VLGTLARVETTDPAVLWRMSRGRVIAHATVFPSAVFPSAVFPSAVFPGAAMPGAASPGIGHVTLTWYFDGQMDRAESYDSMELALARAEHIHGILLRDGWKDL
jgi:hypothetical protein